MHLDTDAYIAIGFLIAIVLVTGGLGTWVIAKLNRHHQ
jgi:hypothetical protein